MDLKKESLLVKIWNVIWPLFIYLIMQNVVVLIGMFFLDYETYAVVFLLISALICIPIYWKMCKKDRRLAGEVKRNIPMENKDYLAIIVSAAALALAMNNLISITPLPEWFDGYEETNEVLSAGGMFLQILTAGIVACIVEELSLRGVTYFRMKQYWGKSRAIFWSALVFGIYHLNVVQGVYAFILGLYFAWLNERYDSLRASITAHMSANLFVILLSTSQAVGHALESRVGYCLITCISLLIFFYGYRFIKQTNPLVELEFVEKEPDTLKGLTKEYQEQEREDET